MNSNSFVPVSCSTSQKTTVFSLGERDMREERGERRRERGLKEPLDQGGFRFYKHSEIKLMASDPVRILCPTFHCNPLEWHFH
jgi:hypothetical protein